MCPATLGHGVLISVDGSEYDDGTGAASAHSDLLLISDGVPWLVDGSEYDDGTGAASAHSDLLLMSDGAS